MRYYNLSIILITVLFIGCSEQKSKSLVDTMENSSMLTPKYAKGFSISTYSAGFLVDVFNPWQGATDVNYRYAFVYPDSSFKPQSATEIIPLPVSRIVCLSTTHIAYIDLLDETSKIIGISGAEYVSNGLVRERFTKSLVKDVGFEQTINFELLLSLKPDVVFGYGVGAEAAGYLHKLKDLKIPVVFIGDYLEDSPLGKAEWLKVFGMILGKYDEADDLFNKMQQECNITKDLVSGVEYKPKIFINLPWNDVWYFPGRDGYMAKLIDDAGGNYLLTELDGNQSYPFSVESALVKGMDADIWINTGSYASLEDIRNSFPRLSSLPVSQNGKIFNNNRRSDSGGGNDFWESGVVNPHVVLKDLVKIFHPDSIEHQMVYYQQLK